MPASLSSQRRVTLVGPRLPVLRAAAVRVLRGGVGVGRRGVGMCVHAARGGDQQQQPQSQQQQQQQNMRRDAKPKHSGGAKSATATKYSAAVGVPPPAPQPSPAMVTGMLFLGVPLLAWAIRSGQADIARHVIGCHATSTWSSRRLDEIFADDACHVI